MTLPPSTAHLPSSSEFLTIRGLRAHIRQWGNPGAPRLFMLHGWMDVSASFQFIVDSLRRDWHVIAPDWRGFGLSERSGRDGYWYPDYLADLEAILQHYSPEAPVRLLGHSMGANVAMLYAGIRPERIAALIDLEGFGLPDRPASDAPFHYARWLDQLRAPARLNDYPTQQDVALRLQKNNPRLTDERAHFLAQHWSARNAQGRWEILGDPLHKNSNPVLFRVAEMLACWQRISAPVLWVEAEEPTLSHLFAPDAAKAEFERRRAHIADVRVERIADAGHMVHHDQPALLAQLIENFLDQRK
ncbi:MAG: alpha/beta hydrolase [Herbaspirillum sp.]|jgi:pimeloyl-ACP methyl ester carboxylesterase|nr:alpha/beta hydrolase [Herbaspirillum sp.]